MAAYNFASRNLTEQGHTAERLLSLAATADFFPLLGLAPPHGRVFKPEEFEPGADNVVVFAVLFWELEAGGPVARIRNPQRTTPDFQFPQDENPQLAAPGWRPQVSDYLYLSLTNSVAFSPTDAMPLVQRTRMFRSPSPLVPLT